MLLSPGMISMWITLASMGFMFIAIILIYFSRYKINNCLLKTIVALIAYAFLIMAGIIIVVVVFGGPVS